MNKHLQYLRTRLKAQNIEGMIITNPVNIRYLTNVKAEGILLLTRKENIYITDARYIEEVKETLTIEDEIIINDIRDISLYDYENFFLFCENVGFEENYVTYAKYKEYIQKYKVNNFVEAGNLIDEIRKVKSPEEIENIKKACQITDECFEYLKTFIKVGMTEKEIAFEIDSFFIRNGAEEPAFETIVASGVNSSKPHHIPSEKKIQSGDPILIDFGCKYNGYCSDMTRMIFVDFVQDYTKKIYDLVLESQEDVIKLMYDGANTKTLFNRVDFTFRNYNYNLTHALGHGVGLDIHEQPIIGGKKEIILKENMVVTNEPGIYVAGHFGIRIEDTCLITKDGCEVLTKSPKGYTIIKG